MFATERKKELFFVCYKIANKGFFFYFNLPQVVSIKLNEKDKEKALKILKENGIEVL